MHTLPIASPAQTRRALGSLLSTRRTYLLLAVVVLSAASVAGLALPAALGRIVDAVIDSRRDLLPILIGVLAGAGILHAVLTASGRLIVARLGEDILAELRHGVVSRLLRVPSRTVEDAGRGDLVSRAAGDSRVVGDVVSNVLPSFAGAGFAIVATLVGLSTIDPRFALAALTAVPVQVIATAGYLRRARPAYLAVRDAEGERARRLMESVDGADTIRAMRVASARERLVDDAATQVVTTQLRAARISVAFWNKLNVAELVGLVAVLATGFVLVRAGEVTVGGATAAALYFHALFAPIGAVLGGVDELQMASAALSRMTGVLTLPEQPARATRAERGPVDVAFERVCFGYDVGFRLDSISFRIPAGRTAALVGASGAGKSTLAALLAGTQTPHAGVIRIGGARLGAGSADGAVPAHREGPAPRVGLAGQEPHVFTCTVAENLRLACPTATDDDLREALAAVEAMEWVDRLPAGIDTVIGAGGHSLTLVESQQLALARVHLHDPDVLVLDEATAAAAGGDRALDRAVARVTRGRTTLAIAHRLDQSQNADLVIVLDDGMVVEQGRHDELVDAGGHYAEIWRAWSANLDR